MVGIWGTTPNSPSPVPALIDIQSHIMWSWSTANSHNWTSCFLFSSLLACFTVGPCFSVVYCCTFSLVSGHRVGLPITGHLRNFCEYLKNYGNFPNQTPPTYWPYTSLHDIVLVLVGWAKINILINNHISPTCQLPEASAKYWTRQCQLLDTQFKKRSLHIYFSNLT